MGKFFPFFCAFTAVLLMGSPKTVTAEPVEHTVTFTGEGVVLAEPDILVLNLTVMAEAPDMKESVADQANKMHGVLALLKKTGVPDKDIKTAGYQYQPQYEWVKNKQVLKGFVTTQQLHIRVDIKKAPALLEGLSALANMDGITYVVSTADQLREKAVSLAIKDAKDRAARRAAELDIVLGAIVAYQENMPRRQQPEVAMAGARAMVSDAAPSVPAGESEIRATVSVTYLIAVK